jgi:hypothetical protein
MAILGCYALNQLFQAVVWRHWRDDEATILNGNLNRGTGAQTGLMREYLRDSYC